MCFFMHQFTGCGSVIFGPLLFNVYDSPLPSAESEVLNAGKHQVVLLRIHG